MKQFASLVAAIDATTRTTGKLQALIDYLGRADDKDKVWCIALLSGKRPRRPVKTALLREWAAEVANIPLWLLEESYFIVGDLAETLAMVMPPPTGSSLVALHERMAHLTGLKQLPPLEVEEYVKSAWAEMDRSERFVFNKLLTGGFRMGVSQKLMVRALAAHTGVDQNEMAHRLMGQWDPLTTSFSDLVSAPEGEMSLSRPYPFYLAYPVEGEVGGLGAVTDWQLEYKWDGIRGQLICRKGEVYLWSRGEELVTDQFPELASLSGHLPSGVVIDGEIMAFKDGRPLSFNHLQTRIGRKNVGRKILADSPVVLMAYDLLEQNGADLRGLPLAERRQRLEEVMAQADHPALLISTIVQAGTWAEAEAIRVNSRDALAEGLMVKRLDSTYKVGRKRGEWWKWKLDPLSIDAVLIYAMRGHGRRANLFSDYTFAVWNGPELVPFAKAYSGLTDKEMQEVDRFVKRHTVERFGPVRSVEPKLVFEIGFEGIAPSTRHKSGIALRFPRMLRWRTDKKPEEANTLDDLKAMLSNY